MTGLQFGDSLPPLAGTGEDLVEAGWHPICGHVRHLGIGERLGLAASPALTYGLLPRRQAMERLGECDVCRVPPTVELGL